MVDLILVSDDEEWSVEMPAVPRVGDLVLAPNFKWQPIPVKRVEWQPKSWYAPTSGSKWRVVVTLDV